MSELYKKSGVDIDAANCLAEKLGILGTNFRNFAGEVVHDSLKYLIAVTVLVQKLSLYITGNCLEQVQLILLLQI